MSPISDPTPTPAAAVILTAGPGSSEVYVVRRADNLRFFGGYHAFPGGKVAAEDSTLFPMRGQDRLVAAVRELFEETGVLLARLPDGSFPPFSDHLTECRHQLLDAKLAFGDFLGGLQLTIHPEDLTPLGAMVTPAFTTMRFDTTFFLAQMPPGQVAEVWPGELVQGQFILPAQLLDRWTKGESLVAPPTLTLLQALRNRPVEELPARLGSLLDDWLAGRMPPIFFAPAVQLLPLRTVALPPSSHTNAYLVGQGPAYLLDPGAKDPAEQQRLFDALDTQIALGRRLQAVILTHHHPDHIGAAAVCAERYHVPLWAHSQTAQLLRERLTIDRELVEGDRLPLGMAPDGTSPWYLEALHTPGHASGHLAFFEPHYGLLFAGDLVSTQSSIIIAPPDGDLAIYLASLRRVQALPLKLLLPAHGSPTSQPRKILDEALDLRSKREEQLRQALEAGPRRVADLIEELYRGVPADLTRYAELQLLAGLRKLANEGIVEATNGEAEPGWRLCSSPKTS